MSNSVISENIKKIRIRYDLNQHELAEIAGVTNKAVSAWETGNKEPRMGAIEKIANHFGIKKSNIIEKDGMDNIEIEDTRRSLMIHFENEDYTKEEIQEIIKYAKYIRSKRT
jgi:transcriptional regulator with XRE-family HTH domain